MAHIHGLLSRDVTSSITKLIHDNLDDTRFKDKHLAIHILSKYTDADPQGAKERAEAAVAKWLGVEKRNSNTNFRLYLDLEDKVIRGLPVSTVLDRAARTIKRLIGVNVPLEKLIGSFSNGASTSKRRSPGTVARKFSERPDVTQECWALLGNLFLQESELWPLINPLVSSPRIVRGNVMFTVPKNNVIDRVAAKEPDINMWFQKAAGDFIRSRLKYVGINLNDQRINQRLAFKGSVDGSLATVDLSSASDSITTQLVCRLLPTDWFYFLDQLRCRETLLPDGTWHENEMFSSMGNAFTFELESLIFYSLTKAVCDLKKEFGIISVYGDDIIMPSSCFDALSAIFSYVGFKVNDDKSFYQGSFRESCGKHYYAGVDVTPFYIRRPINNVPDLIKILNQLRSWCQTGHSWCDSDWYRTWQEIAKLVPNKFLFGGYDLASNETVVSYEGKGYRFRRVFQKRKPLWAHDGMYLEWQANARKVSHKGMSAYQFPHLPLRLLAIIAAGETTRSAGLLMYETSLYKVVKPRKDFARAFGMVGPAFPQELPQRD